MGTARRIVRSSSRVASALALALVGSAGLSRNAGAQTIGAAPPSALGAVAFTPAPRSIDAQADEGPSPVRDGARAQVEGATNPPLPREQRTAAPAATLAAINPANILTIDPPGLTPEGGLLAALHEAERAQLPVARTLAEAVAVARVRDGSTLPTGLDASLVSRLEPSTLAPQLNPRVLQELALFRTDTRARRALQGWVRRAGRYRARLEAILAAEGVPTDLVWVAAIESSFNPTDISSAGAAGLWQLMPQTARTYGLRVDAWVDERRDPERATLAAARYLRDLRARLGSWELALAAYNMGYGAVLRSVRRFNSTDFETLAALEAGLPYETVRYVPRILALATAARNPGDFALATVEPEPAIRWEDVALARSLPLDSVARSLGVAPEALRSLNPALRGGRTPVVLDTGGAFALHVPEGRGGRDAEARIAGASTRANALRVYQLRYGESVDELARRYGLSTSDLLGLSGIATEARAVAGTALLVPDREPAPLSTPAATERPVVAARPVSEAPAGRRRVFYRVGHGDELATVARVLRVSRADLLRWNALDDQARLVPGLWLQAYVGDEPLTEARVYEPSEVTVLEPGTEAFHERIASLDGRTRRRITVREGDTMASIARHHGITVGTLARINRRSRRATLTPGEELFVYESNDDDATTASPRDDVTAVREGAAEREGHHRHHERERDGGSEREQSAGDAHAPSHDAHAEARHGHRHHEHGAQTDDNSAAPRVASAQAPAALEADRGDADADQVRAAVRE